MSRWLILGVLLSVLALDARAQEPVRVSTPEGSRAATALRAGMVVGGGVPTARLDRVDRLSPLERRLLERVLEEQGLEIELDPHGKRIDAQHIVNLDVFGPDDIFPLWLNDLRFKTRPRVVTDRMLIGPGDAWDEEAAQRSRRNITNTYQQLFSVVLVMPIRSATPDAVDLLVITKDIWSLRANSNFQVTGDTLDFLSASISENNFLGYGFLLAISMLLEPDHISFGPQFVDDGLFGTGLRLNTLVRFATNLDTGAFEGATGFVDITYPIRSLAQVWTGGVVVDFRDIVERRFRAGTLLRFPLDREEGEPGIPWVWRDRYVNGRADLSRLFSSEDLRLAFTFGWGFFFRDGERIGDNPAAPEEVLDDFERTILPRSERSSYPLIALRLFSPHYKSYRDLELMNLTEDYRMGPDVVFEFRYGHPWLGSNRSFIRLISQLQYRLTLSGADMLTGFAEIASSLEGVGWIDTRLKGQLRYASSPLLFFRLHASVYLEMRLDDPSNTLLSLGGDNGLRGFASAQLLGSGFMRGNLELRTLPLELWTLSFGLVTFYDVGDAFEDDFQNLRLKHSIGLGLRVGIPQTNRQVFRVDWGFPVSEASVWPGLVSLGFEQAF